MLLSRTVSLNAPQVGMLVSVRDRHWIVRDVVASTISDPLAQNDEPQHLLQLSSVEDDGFADELSVIWEIEPGARIIEDANLPTPIAGEFDDPRRLKTFLDAVRWGAITSADTKVLQAPFRSGITIEEYQLDPVVRALQMARVNLLIADDVGLGKTIEAGLIVQELILRHRARTVLILCPPSLSLKWQAEMRDRFGLAFRIVDLDAVRMLRRERGVGANIFSHYPRLIVSFDWLKADRPMRLLREFLPPEPTSYPRRIDLMIVDEVHQCAPAGNGKYATDSQRTELLRFLGPYAEHRLFLSATPHNGYESSFSALLELLDPQRFARGVKPDATALQQAVIRRMKADIRKDLGPRADGSARFPERKIDKIEVEYPREERKVHADLAEYTELRRSQSGSPRAGLAADLVTLLLKKRLFSSPAAFAGTLEQHMKTLSEAGKHEGDAGTIRDAYDRSDADFEEDEEREDATFEALRVAARAGAPISPRQIELLEGMQHWANGARLKADQKSRELIQRLNTWCRPNGTWTEERVIIFTEYRDTQRWLRQLLTDAGLGGNRLSLLYGGMDGEERERIKAAFQSDPSKDPVRILLATDTASEGIDLQRHCYRLVHMEIPFNPNRLEQRNGRIDRHGQPKDEVLIYHFVGKEYQQNAEGLEGDLDFLFRAAKKLEKIRADLGKAGAVLAAQVEDAMLGRKADLSIIKEDSAESKIALKAERSLRERVREIRDQIDESVKELGLTPEAVKEVVSLGLELGRQSPLEPIELPSNRNDGSSAVAYTVPELTRSWQFATENLYHPLTGDRLPITFDNEAADGREDVVLAHLGHRIVAQAMRLLRSEIWAPANEARLRRVSGSIVRDADLEAPVVIVDARLVVMGIDGYRLHEQVFCAGGRLGGRRRFARLNVGDVRAALNSTTLKALPREFEEEIAGAWPEIKDSVLAGIDARAKELLSGVDRQLRERAHSEIQSLETVMKQLAESIKRELDEARAGQSEQLSFFDAGSERERLQVSRDVDALHRRLGEIPGELQVEAARLERRFSEQRHVVFPAAVRFLVPKRFVDGGSQIFEGSRS